MNRIYNKINKTIYYFSLNNEKYYNKIIDPLLNYLNNIVINKEIDDEYLIVVIKSVNAIKNIYNSQLLTLNGKIKSVIKELMFINNIYFAKMIVCENEIVYNKIDTITEDEPINEVFCVPGNTLIPSSYTISTNGQYIENFSYPNVNVSTSNNYIITSGSCSNSANYFRCEELYSSNNSYSGELLNTLLTNI